MRSAKTEQPRRSLGLLVLDLEVFVCRCALVLRGALRLELFRDDDVRNVSFQRDAERLRELGFLGGGNDLARGDDLGLILERVGYRARVEDANLLAALL